MSIKWNKQTFKALEELWESDKSRASMREEELTRISRCEITQCMMEKAQVWLRVNSPEMRKGDAE